jgi:hypothetical protein
VPPAELNRWRKTIRLIFVKAANQKPSIITAQSKLMANANSATRSVHSSIELNKNERGTGAEPLSIRIDDCF